MSSTIRPPPRAQLCIRYCSNKHNTTTHTRTTNGSAARVRTCWATAFKTRAQQGPKLVASQSNRQGVTSPGAVAEEERRVPSLKLRAMMTTPWLTGAGAVGQMRIRWTVEAHVASQDREITIWFGKGVSLFRETTNLITNYEF